MNELEILNAYYEWNSLGVADIGLYISILFAYFIAAHLAGSSISRRQLLVASSVYVAVMLFLLNQMLAHMLIADRLGDRLIESESDLMAGLISSSETTIIVGIFWLISLIASLYYMRVCRKKAP